MCVSSLLDTETTNVRSLASVTLQYYAVSIHSLLYMSMGIDAITTLINPSDQDPK